MVWQQAGLALGRGWACDLGQEALFLWTKGYGGLRTLALVGGARKGPPPRARVPRPSVLEPPLGRCLGLGTSAGDLSGGQGSLPALPDLTLVLLGGTDVGIGARPETDLCFSQHP